MGLRVFPSFLISQALNPSGSYLESKWSGLTRTTLPSFTSTAHGQAPKIPPLRPRDLYTVFSLPTLPSPFVMPFTPLLP